MGRVRPRWLWILVCLCNPAWAGDHEDGPAASALAEADLAGLYAWMNADADTLNIVLTAHPAATSSSTFPEDIQYVVHIHTMTAYGAESESGEKRIICTFDEDQIMSCWTPWGTHRGDSTKEATTNVAVSGFQGWSGVANDPHYFNKLGFGDVTAGVKGINSLSQNTAGCPDISATRVSNYLDYFKKTSTGSGSALDFFNGSNVLAIAMTISRDLISASDKVVGIWASSHQIDDGTSEDEEEADE